MNLLRLALVWLLVAGLHPAVQAKLTPEQVQQLPKPANRTVSFANDIQPILRQSCVNCHGRGRSKGGFQLDTRETLMHGGDSGAAVVPGKSAESLMIELVSGLDPDNVMPRKGRKLTSEEVGLLRAWIDQGMQWDDSVSFARPVPLNLSPHPPGVDIPPGENPIDILLGRYFPAKGVKADAPVNDRLFARRVYLDAIGLLPPPKELEAFESDEDPYKRERLVARVLANRQEYAAHWLTFWNDLLRNDYRGTGYIDGGRRQITPWLLDALSNNIPYTRFVAELLNPTAESEGFVKGIIWRGVVNASQTPEMQAAQNVSQVFMGVNLKCASCHDSFINDWRLSDAYGLAAVYSDGPLEMFQCDKPTGNTVRASFIYPQLGEIDASADKASKLKRLAQIVTSEQNGRLSRTIVNRLWGRFFGRGLVEPVDDMEQKAWDQDLLDWLAEDLARNGYDIKRTIGLILSSEAYQLPAVDLGEVAPKDFVFRGPAVRRLSAEQFRDALAELTGIWFGKAEFGGFTNQVRASLVATDPLMTALGRPNREQVVTTRSGTATTLQALELTNGETLASLLERGATRLVSLNTTPTDLLSRVYLQALGRSPTPAEKTVALEQLGNKPEQDRVEDLLWTVSMLPEFQMIH